MVPSATLLSLHPSTVSPTTTALPFIEFHDQSLKGESCSYSDTGDNFPLGIQMESMNYNYFASAPQPYQYMGFDVDIGTLPQVSNGGLGATPVSA